MKHIFGPVPSRRLGLSLGVDIIPFKTCTLSCVYCQIGDTPRTTRERREYAPTAEIIAEVRDYLANHPRPDWITFSGSGEPTLHSGLGAIIRGIKAFTAIPLCVITNGTTLMDPAVRSDLLDADAVMPSLDSARDESFRLVCRPEPSLRIADVIRGLAGFRREFHGKIWLEILLVAGLNDTPEDLDALRAAIGEIAPDSVQLNTVVRPPAESAALPLTRERMEEIRDFFGPKAEIIASFAREAQTGTPVTPEDILGMIERHPATTEEIGSALGAETEAVEKMLGEMERTGRVKSVSHLGKQWWEKIL